MGQIIMVLLGTGYQATGRAGGLPMDGRESGLRVIGNTVLSDQKID